MQRGRALLSDRSERDAEHYHRVHKLAALRISPIPSIQMSPRSSPATQTINRPPRTAKGSIGNGVSATGRRESPLSLVTGQGREGYRWIG